MWLLHSEIVSITHLMTLRPDAAMAAEYHDDKQQENEEQQTSNYSADASNNGISEGSANEGTSGSLGN